jgi:ribosomal protein S18 acetylase RimI-like enzyme
MAISIHRITPSNTSLLANIAEDVFDDDIAADRLETFLADSRHAMLVAMDGDRVVGQIRGNVHLQPDRASDLYIDNLGVSPSHQRRGIARQLIGALINWASAEGCTYAWVATETDNDGGIRFYEAQRFERRTLEWFATTIDTAGS